jgi:Prokaryotic Cytochrome C oxidase subunit IV
MDENQSKMSELYRVGVSVMIILAFLTIGEYLIGSTAFSWYMPLLAIALIKAFFVVRDYMHLPRLFAPEEENHG